ncbi:hypothetical protein ACH5RR_002833 [Cinchona calisaya]|uniref:Uncharacterized protein n=1 Tax=Cinchona calisaya TaxID=153742 RepID=A0ABD3ATQ6_9GENT
MAANKMASQPQPVKKVQWVPKIAEMQSNDSQQLLIVIPPDIVTYLNSSGLSTTIKSSIMVYASVDLASVGINEQVKHQLLGGSVSVEVHVDLVSAMADTQAVH